MLSEAQRFWDAIVGKVRKVAQEVTKNTFRCERYTVTTAPNGTKMGVTLPMGSKEIMLPYSQEVASATVGSQVLVVWWGSMSNAKVYFFADGYSGNQWKMYNSVRQLGLTVGSATIDGAYAALAANQMLICPAADFASGQVPNRSGGMVEMIKRYNDGSSGRITYWGMRESDGVYEMFISSYPFTPTGTWVYFGQDVDYKIYNSVTDLGLTSGSATISGAYSAMPIPSILICPIEEFSSDQKPPSGISVANFYGTIEIIKTSSNRGSIFAYGKRVEHGDWRMYIVDGTNAPSGTWVCGQNAAADGTVTKTFTGTFTNDTTWIQCDGHLAILNLQVRYSTGFGTDDWTDIYSVSPAPIKAVYYSFDFNGQHATVRIKTDGAVQILGYGSAYTQFARFAIPYFY